MTEKTVLITGSSRGIGKAAALYLADGGYDIVLHCSKNPGRLSALEDEIRSKGRKCRTLAFDVKDRAQTSEILLKDIEENGDKFSAAVGAIVQDNVENYVGQVVDQLVSICTNAVSQANSVEYVKEKLKQWSDATDFGSEATNKIKEQAVQYIITQGDSKIDGLITKMKEGGDAAKNEVSSLMEQLNDCLLYTSDAADEL